jgi:hypothetical protein
MGTGDALREGFLSAFRSPLPFSPLQRRAPHDRYSERPGSLVERVLGAQEVLLGLERRVIFLLVCPVQTLVFPSMSYEHHEDLQKLSASLNPTNGVGRGC